MWPAANHVRWRQRRRPQRIPGSANSSPRFSACFRRIPGYQVEFCDVCEGRASEVRPRRSEVGGPNLKVELTLISDICPPTAGLQPLEVLHFQVEVLHFAPAKCGTSISPCQYRGLCTLQPICHRDYSPKNRTSASSAFIALSAVPRSKSSSSRPRSSSYSFSSRSA